MIGDPLADVDARAMSLFQWRIVAIMVALNALDGFDVLSISFASPGIVRDWGIDRAALGIVLSMELIGMATGSILLSGVADRLGRRRTILGCLAVMATGMVAASAAGSVLSLSLWRVLTGLGIGGMLATTNAAVAEAANARRRSLCVILMATGYPIGAVLGGALAAHLLATHDWPIVFQLGGLATLACVPAVVAWVPESLHLMMRRGAPGDLAAVNDTLARMGHPAMAAMPARPARMPSIPVRQLFAPALAMPTVLLTAAYLGHIMTFYFILKWVPKIVVDMGFAPSLAGGVLVWANVGGAAGALLLGLLTLRIRVRLLTIAALGMAAAMVIWFGRGARDLTGLSMVAAAAGFFTNAGVVGLYALVADTFPTEVRATATGFAIGIGRGGSALAPALAGALFAAGYGLQSVSTLMAMGSVIAVLALIVLGRTHAAKGDAPAR